MPAPLLCGQNTTEPKKTSAYIVVGAEKIYRSSKSAIDIWVIAIVYLPYPTAA
jgi:hypothetical protein